MMKFTQELKGKECVYTVEANGETILITEAELGTQVSYEKFRQALVDVFLAKCKNEKTKLELLMLDIERRMQKMKKHLC